MARTNLAHNLEALRFQGGDDPGIIVGAMDRADSSRALIPDNAAVKIIEIMGLGTLRPLARRGAAGKRGD